MTNIEQAKQEILSVMLYSGLTINELLSLPGQVQERLYNMTVDPCMTFSEGGEQNDD